MRHGLSGGHRLLSRVTAVALSALLLLPLDALPLRAQTAPPATPPATTDSATESASEFSMEQLDALLAPIALYPDALLTQILMAATEPLQIVQAKRWLNDPAHSALKGDALTRALAAQSWDPSVKSLVPFPQVLDMMNANLDWTQQLGYAFATQQADVLDSVQRLRRQAQAAGHLQSSPQQVVTTQADALVIQPADPQVVFVPHYNPTVVYGQWPYPSSPPVYFPPPPGYALGTALATGLAFGAGIAITAGLWNLATPNWGWRGPGYGGVNVNVNRWNTVNVNRPPLHGNTWRPPPSGRPGGWTAGRPPSGPVGQPRRQNGVPPGAIGRPNVNVPGNLVNRPARPPGNPPPLRRPGGNGPAGQRPGGGGTPQRPGGGQLPQRPGGGGAGVQRPATRPAAPPRGNGGAFGSMNEGRQAGQFASRGSQSRNAAPARPNRGGAGGGQRGGGPRGGGGGHGGRNR